MTYKKDPGFKSLFLEAAYIVQTTNAPRWVACDYVYGPHAWHGELQQRFRLHPVVDRIVTLGVRPVDWQQLLLEWPHISEEDAMQIAYTRDERKGQDNVQTRTSIGKYLARHWPHVADHTRRDWSEAFGNHKFELWDTKEKIICGIELGAQSCMRSSYGSIPFDESDHEALCAWYGDEGARRVPWDNHPYAVYAPEYGWRMAVRLDPSDPERVQGRGLVNINGKQFVRTYKRGELDSSNSGSDERLEAWLVTQGYKRESSWDDGLRLRRIAHPTEHDAPFMVPYLDGGVQTVEAYETHLTIDCGGPFKCDNTDGTPDGEVRESIGCCECCGATVYDEDEDRIWAGSDEDTLIGGCCSNDYTNVRGASLNRRGYSTYYVPDEQAIEVRGESYDKENLPDCIMELVNGDYEHEAYCVYSEAADGYYLMDEVIRCETDEDFYPLDDTADYGLVEIDGKWYEEDDDDIFEFENAWYLKANGWQDEETEAWYPDEVASVELNGCMYHPSTLLAIAKQSATATI